MDMAKILLIEDDAPLLRLYQGALEAEHDVIGVESTGAALDVLAEYDPNLVILDLNLPDAPGTRVLQHLEAEQRDIRVIAMTGFSQHRQAADSPQIVKMLDKPVTATMLMQAVRMALVNH
jgi:DNA-binding NtrC family response regulator